MSNALVSVWSLTWWSQFGCRYVGLNFEIFRYQYSINVDASGSRTPTLCLRVLSLSILPNLTEKRTLDPMTGAKLRNGLPKPHASALKICVHFQSHKTPLRV